MPHHRMLADETLLQLLTQVVRRDHAEIIEYRLMEGRERMERLKEKLAQAAMVAPRATARIEREADRLIAREREIDQKTNKAFAPHHALLDSHNRDLDQLQDALKIVSNADPLESSSDASQDDERTSDRVSTLEGVKNEPAVTAAPPTTFRAEAEEQIARGTIFSATAGGHK